MPSRRRLARLGRLVVGCGLVLGCPWTAHAQHVGYTGAISAVRGTYPTARVDSSYVFSGVDISGGPVRVAVTIPFMHLETTPSIVVPDGTSPAPATTNSGFGDPLARFDLLVVNKSERGLQLGVAAAVKMPLIDASTGRGTGEVDYGVGGSAFKIVSRTSLMADLLFWKYGDPEGIDFTDTWSYSVGVAQIIGNGRWSALVSLAGFSSGIDGASPPLALNVALMRLVGHQQSLAVSASIGLNDSSSDFSIGTSWRIGR